MAAHQTSHNLLKYKGLDIINVGPANSSNG